MCLSSREHWMCLSKTCKREAAHKGPPAAEEGLPVLACRGRRHAWPGRVGDGERPGSYAGTTKGSANGSAFCSEVLCAASARSPVRRLICADGRPRRT